MTSSPAEMWLPLALFSLFALLSVVGAYFAAAHLRGWKAGVWAALATAVFFGALLLGLGALMRDGGVF
jgi:predicted phage tail protein